METPAEVLSAVTAQRPFSINRAMKEFWPLASDGEPIQSALEDVRTCAGDLDTSAIEKAIVRSAFLIELVELPGVETTLFQTRWTSKLADDPRGASYEECALIAAGLLASLPGWLAVDRNQSLFSNIASFSVLPYEAPIDYCVRSGRTAGDSKIHRPGNVAWVATDGMVAAAELRAFLLDRERSPDAEFFANVIKKKIVVKSYLTDRAQTGDYKTNREKRWETHPNSGQFALRRDCMEIEWKAITQICQFAGFPSKALDSMRATGALPDELVAFRCPVTLDVIDFGSFKSELSNRTHGRSDFQMGHLNPLKLGDPAGDAIGHTPSNISWISADGNRIQGSLSVDKTRELLRRIARNYEAFGDV